MPQPPSGVPAPRRVTGPGGDELDLVALAEEVSDRYYEQFPDELERYGPAGRDWCRHDLQHKLNWAALAVEGLVDLDQEVAWLARLLEVRGFPVARLARSLDLAADVVREQVAEGEAMAATLDGTAGMLRRRQTFVD